MAQLCVFFNFSHSVWLALVYTPLVTPEMLHSQIQVWTVTHSINQWMSIAITFLGALIPHRRTDWLETLPNNGQNPPVPNWILVLSHTFLVATGSPPSHLLHFNSEKQHSLFKGVFSISDYGNIITGILVYGHQTLALICFWIYIDFCSSLAVCYGYIVVILLLQLWINQCPCAQALSCLYMCIQNLWGIGKYSIMMQNWHSVTLFPISMIQNEKICN